MYSLEIIYLQFIVTKFNEIVRSEVYFHWNHIHYNLVSGCVLLSWFRSGAKFVTVTSHIFGFRHKFIVLSYSDKLLFQK